MENKDHAIRLLRDLGAPEHLIKHGELVCEVAELLTTQLGKIGLIADEGLVQTGAILHDCGKIIHTEELYQPGRKHENAGRELLLTNGIHQKIADFCVSHATWDTDDVSLEELIVALADKLWKGKREAALELFLIDYISEILNLDRWEVFTQVDSIFENIAADADKRLKRSIIE